MTRVSLRHSSLQGHSSRPSSKKILASDVVSPCCRYFRGLLPLGFTAPWGLPDGSRGGSGVGTWDHIGNTALKA